MVRQVPDFLVHVKGLGEEIDYMTVLSLILKIDLHMLRKGLKVAVIPDQADLIEQDQRIGRKLDLTEVLDIKQIASWNLTVRINLPAFFLILDSKLEHKGRLTGSLFALIHPFFSHCASQ